MRKALVYKTEAITSLQAGKTCHFCPNVPEGWMMLNSQRVYLCEKHLAGPSTSPPTFVGKRPIQGKPERTK